MQDARRIPYHLHFFGSDDGWAGRCGVNGNVGRFGFTVHLAPYEPRWGYRVQPDEDGAIHSFDVGPIVSLVWRIEGHREG